MDNEQGLRELYRPLAESLVAGRTVAMDNYTADRLRQLFGLEFEQVKQPGMPDDPPITDLTPVYDPHYTN